MFYIIRQSQNNSHLKAIVIVHIKVSHVHIRTDIVLKMEVQNINQVNPYYESSVSNELADQCKPCFLHFLHVFFQSVIIVPFYLIQLLKG